MESPEETDVVPGVVFLDAVQKSLFFFDGVQKSHRVCHLEYLVWSEIACVYSLSS